MFDYIFATKDEAVKVFDAMSDIIDQFSCVTLGDLKSLVGVPSVHTDEHVGWTELKDVEIREVPPSGFMLVLPQPKSTKGP